MQQWQRKWQSQGGQASWGLTLGELFNPSEPRSLNLFQMGMIAPAPTGPIRIRHEALHWRKCCSGDLLWLLDIVTSSVLGPVRRALWSEGPHSDLNLLTVSEGLRRPFYSEREFMAQSDHPLFFSLAEEAAKLAFICNFGISSHLGFQLFVHSNSLILI